MLEKIAKGRAALRGRLNRLLTRADWMVQRLLRLWRWLNALDIPLSLLQWILLFYAAFGLIYALATPIFEANDELWHFGYVETLRETGKFPLQRFDGGDSVYRQHGSQPPLYYFLMALATSPLPIDDSADYRSLNPHVAASQPDSYGNKNLIIHDDALSPFRGTGLAVLLTRALSLVMGAGTIVFVYKIGEIAAPQRPTVAFVAAAITGLNPMFIFVSASVNNDSLAMLLNSALVWLTLRMFRDGFSLRRTLAFGLLFALTSLTKLAGLALLPVLLAVAFVVSRKNKDRESLLKFLYVVALFWLLIASWWYFRNLQLYGEPFGIVGMATVAGPRGPTFNLADLLAEYQQFRMSYWGLFGALNIQLAGALYLLFDLMTFMSLIGCVMLGLQLLAISDFAYARYELAHLLTLAAALLLLWLCLLFFSFMTPVAEGRALFPLIGVVSPLLALGFVEVVWWIVFSLRPPNLEFVRAGDAVPKELLHDTMLWQLRCLAVVALVVPFTVIASQYGAPQPLEAVPERALPVYAEFGDVALVAYERVDRRYATGDRVKVKLYWRVLRPSARDDSLFLTLVDDRRHAIGQYATYPGAGSLRTTRWEAGAIYPDEYVIHISRAAYGRYPFDLRVQWGGAEGAIAIEATDAAGAAIEPVLLNIGAVVASRSQPAVTGFSQIPLDSQPLFDESIRLESFKLDLERNEIALNWKAETAPSEEYTVFAHLLAAEGNLVDQDDRSPRLPTKYWRWGESYTTHHRFAAERNIFDYTLAVGWYINDGLTNPKLEFIASVVEEDEESEVTLDAYEIPWEISAAALELTATAPPEEEDAAREEADGHAPEDAEASAAAP